MTSEFCGANYDPRNNDTAISANFEANEDSIYILAGVYLACSLLGVAIVGLFSRPLHTFDGVSDTDSSLTGKKLLIATFQQMKNPFQILIITLTMWSGFEQAFITADFTAVSNKISNTKPGKNT